MTGNDVEMRALWLMIPKDLRLTKTELNKSTASSVAVTNLIQVEH